VDRPAHRPLLLALDDGDGGVIVQAGAPLPASGSFPWRAKGAEARVSIQQGQSSGSVAPLAVGVFLARDIQPKSEGPTTIDCHVTVQRDGAIHFRATQDGRKLRVGWMPPKPGK
jgi:hypothetical protein